VALFKLLLSNSNFLILDEPTNHLDMNTREIFQRALLQYGGTMLIVSHDRFFLDNLVDRVLEIRGGKLYNYAGNYSYFIERRAAMTVGEASPAAQAVPTDTKEKRRIEAEERNRIYRERKIFADKIAPIENRIAENEKRKTEIETSLCCPEILSDSAKVQSLMLERKKIEETLAADYAEWENLSKEMEKIK
jgi:ATP-binding cassette subfamily F protein 3